MATSGFAAEHPAGRRYQSIAGACSMMQSSDCVQCHVDSRGTRLNTDLLWRQVKVYLGERDVTSQFRETARLVLGDGVLGLQPVYYEVEMTQDSLLVDYSYHEQTLSCRASLAPRDVPPTLNSSLVHKDAALNVTLLCETHWLLTSPS